MSSQLQWLTSERLATLIYEELDRDSWGDVDPYWIKMVAEGNYAEDDDHHDQAEALGKVFDRVVERLKRDFDAPKMALRGFTKKCECGPPIPGRYDGHCVTCGGVQ